MGYLKKKMTAGEHLVYVAKLHWIIFLRPVLTAVIILTVIAFIEHERLYTTIPEIIAYKAHIYQAILLLFVAWPLLKIAVIKWTTNIGITDRRVLYKRGFIAIELNGMPLAKIENTDMQQTVMGRILGYGTVTVKGSGSTSMRLDDIAKPMRFRNELATLLSQQ